MDEWMVRWMDEEVKRKRLPIEPATYRYEFQGS